MSFGRIFLVLLLAITGSVKSEDDYKDSSNSKRPKSPSPTDYYSTEASDDSYIDKVQTADVKYDESSDPYTSQYDSKSEDGNRGNVDDSEEDQSSHEYNIYSEESSDDDVSEGVSVVDVIGEDVSDVDVSDVDVSSGNVTGGDDEDSSSSESIIWYDDFGNKVDESGESSGEENRGDSREEVINASSADDADVDRVMSNPLASSSMTSTQNYAELENVDEILNDVVEPTSHPNFTAEELQSVDSGSGEDQPEEATSNYVVGTGAGNNEYVTTKEESNDDSFTTFVTDTTVGSDVTDATVSIDDNDDIVGSDDNDDAVGSYDNDDAVGSDDNDDTVDSDDTVGSDANDDATVGSDNKDYATQSSIIEGKDILTVIEEEEKVPLTDADVLSTTKIITSVIIVLAVGLLMFVVYVGRKKFLGQKKEQEYKNLLGEEYSDGELEAH